MIKKAFEGIIQNAEQNAAWNEGDYIGDDGLVYCGKCRTRKQYRLTLPWTGEERAVPTPCQCRLAEIEKEELRAKRIEWEKKIDLMRRDGITDDEYLKWTFDKDDGAHPKITEVAKKYCNEWSMMRERNIGILFYGGVGTGKTFMAAAIANELLSQGVRVLMASSINLIGGITAYSDNITDKVMNVDLLVMDDLGAERGTPMALENLYKIIDTRYRSGKPMVVTTNISLEHLKNPPDINYKRAYDRVLEMCVPVQVAGESRRAKLGKDKRDEMAKLLGF